MVLQEAPMTLTRRAALPASLNLLQQVAEMSDAPPIPAMRGIDPRIRMSSKIRRLAMAGSSPTMTERGTPEPRLRFSAAC
jgi:hypothetical protein